MFADRKPSHEYCPKGETYWCGRQRDYTREHGVTTTTIIRLLLWRIFCSHSLISWVNQKCWKVVLVWWTHCLHILWLSYSCNALLYYYFLYAWLFTIYFRTHTCSTTPFCSVVVSFHCCILVPLLYILFRCYTRVYITLYTSSNNSFKFNLITPTVILVASAYESLHHILWNFCPKMIFPSSTIVAIAAGIAVLQFNRGSISTSWVLKDMSINPGPYCIALPWLWLHNQVLERYQIWKQEKELNGLLDAQEETKGVQFGAGQFNVDTSITDIAQVFILLLSMVKVITEAHNWSSMFPSIWPYGNLHHIIKCLCAIWNIRNPMFFSNSLSIHKACVRALPRTMQHIYAVLFVHYLPT